MSDQYVADDERDAILDRLLTIPENKVSLPHSVKPSLRCVSTARARTPSGRRATSASSCVTSALPTIGITECIFPSSGKSSSNLCSSFSSSSVIDSNIEA